MKTCTKCGTKYQAITGNFYRDVTKSDKFHSWCIPCVKARQARWRKTNPDIAQANAKRNRAKMGRTYDLRKLYGITAEQYDAILDSQGGVCAICGIPSAETAKRRLAVDHDHNTGRNRGLLCTCCNHALERIENDPDWGTKALNYLARFIEQTVSH